MTKPDQEYMTRALALAERGLTTTDPNPRVGCLLVKNDVVIGEGWHERAGEAHAERRALEAATQSPQDSTAYVSLEPCCHHGRTPPCTEALIRAGVKRVVVAMVDPNPAVAGQGLAQLRAAGITVECGLLASQARELNPGFCKRMQQGLPWLRCKLAMSLDGRTAMASGESQWITSASAREDVQRLRARSSAIMTGVATIHADDPALNVRLAGYPGKQPLRIILDTRLRTPPEARTLTLPGQVLIYTAVSDTARYRHLQQAGAEVKTVAATPSGLDLAAVLRDLGRRQLNEVHLECGATLAGALLQAGLLDELVIYLAPLILGDSARGLFRLPGLKTLAEGIKVTVNDVCAIGPDWRLSARVSN